MVQHIVGDEFVKQSLKLLYELVQSSENERVTRRAATAMGVFVAKSGGAFATDIVKQVMDL